MTIYINNTPLETSDGATLADVLATQQLPGRGVADAVDNRMVQRSQWSATTLNDGAKILIIKAACGG